MNFEGEAGGYLLANGDHVSLRSIGITFLSLENHSAASFRARTNRHGSCFF